MDLILLNKAREKAKHNWIDASHETQVSISTLIKIEKGHEPKGPIRKAVEAYIKKHLKKKVKK